MNRTKIQANADATRIQLGVPACESRSPIADAMELCDEIQYGLIWSRDVLSIKDRLIVAITVCCQRSMHQKLQQLCDAGAAHDLPLSSVVEICLQTGIYAGFAATESALAHLNAELPAIPSTVAADQNDGLTLAEFAKLGAETRERLHGERQTDGYADPTHPFASDLYEIASNHCYGLIWNRPGLTLRERLICALAALNCQPGANGSFRKFVQSAVGNEVALGEVVETVMQTVPYAGFPTALANLVAIGEMYPDSELEKAIESVRSADHPS